MLPYPLLLAAMVFLVWGGPGALSLDAGLRRRSPALPRVSVAALNQHGDRGGIRS